MLAFLAYRKKQLYVIINWNRTAVEMGFYEKQRILFSVKRPDEKNINFYFWTTTNKLYLTIILYTTNLVKGG